MFLGFTDTKISNNHKLLSFNNLLLLFYQALPFQGKNLPPPPNCLKKKAELQPLINQNYLFHFFFTINKANNNKIN